MNRNLLPFLTLALLATITADSSTVFAQGSLTPPGAPAPLFKTLQQVEPRTPVDDAHTPGDGGNQFIISQPGSYYLATNIVGVSAKSGIRITANNVTLDLKGLALTGIPGSFVGVHAPGATNIIVRNGTISGWGNQAVNAADNATLEHLTVSANAFDGLRCGSGAVVRDCTVSGNGFHGIAVGGASVVSDCLVKNNGQIGIAVSDSGCLISGNNCFKNNTQNVGGYANIRIDASNNRLEGNHLTGPSANGFFIPNLGIYTNNLIIRNSVSGDGANNYATPGAQVVGPLITTAGTITNVNPWANFSY